MSVLDFAFYPKNICWIFTGFATLTIRMVIGLPDCRIWISTWLPDPVRIFSMGYSTVECEFFLAYSTQYCEFIFDYLMLTHFVPALVKWRKILVLLCVAPLKSIAVEKLTIKNVNRFYKSVCLTLSNPDRTVKPFILYNSWLMGML